MRYDTRYRTRSSFFDSSFPNGVKWLLISNIAVYLVYFFAVDRLPGLFFPLQLIPYFVEHGAVWQLVTYLFLHDPHGVLHILFNMLALWMFGTPVEQTWGTRRFLQYYFLCGVGAGMCVVLVNILFGNPLEPTIGASGAIFGLLLAFGMLFPDQEILFMFLFPLKAKYAVMIYGAIAFLGTLSPGGTVSHLAHLGGMIFGYVYIKTQFSRKRVRVGAGSSINFNLGQAWKDYKIQRAKKKFQVYMKKHGNGPWVN
jgi:membrane associated rhomboid family serine protease